jgi:hypothetical protein
MNSDKMEVSINGTHDFSLDIRQCRVGCLVFYENQNRSRLQMTACWNLTYRLYAGIFSNAHISIEYWLFDDEGDELDAVGVHLININNQLIVNSTTYTKSAEFEYTCQENTTYCIAVMFEVILSVFSSIEGRSQDKPATLKVYNITIQEV